MSHWEHEAKPVLEAVARADPTHSSINAQLGREDGDPRTDRALSALVETGYIEGEWEIDQMSGRVVLGDPQLTEKGRQEVSGWPRPAAGGPSLAISDSTIGQLAMGDINNLTPVGLFEAWERQLEATAGSEAEKEEARGVLLRAKEMVAQTGTGAAGGLLADALRASFGGLAG